MHDAALRGLVVVAHDGALATLLLQDPGDRGALGECGWHRAEGDVRRRAQVQHGPAARRLRDRITDKITPGTGEPADSGKGRVGRESVGRDAVSDAQQSEERRGDSDVARGTSASARVQAREIEGVYESVTMTGERVENDMRGQIVGRLARPREE